MEQRKLGATGLTVSCLGFGGAAVSGEGGGYGFGKIDEQQAIALIKACCDQGISLFDTAPIYGFGLSERRIGKALRDIRERVCIASKGGIAWDERRRVRIDNRPQTIESMLHQSLRDLDTEYLDIYFLHWPDQDVDVRKPVEYLARAQEQGLIRHIGLSNTTVEDISKAEQIMPVQVLQGEYNILKRKAEQALFPSAIEGGRGFMNWGVFEKGILSGRVTKDRRFDDPCDSRASAPWWTKVDHAPAFAAYDAISEILSDSGSSALALALAHSLSKPAISSVLVGVRDQLQLEAAVQALDNLPGPEMILACEEAVQRIAGA